MVFNNQLKDSTNNNNLTTKLTNMLNNTNNNNTNVKQLSINNKLNINGCSNGSNQSNVNNGLSSSTNISKTSSITSASSTTFNHVGNLVNGASSPSSTNTVKKILSNDDKKINLNALKNQDPFATNILDTALRVAVYKFLSKKNEWKKMDVEGSLFLFERIVEPLHSFAVMNTLALNLFLQPITSDLEFQDRNPFLLYKSNNDIFGIWFIDKEDCERIKNLIVSLTHSAKERRERKHHQKSTTSSNIDESANLINNLMTPTLLEQKTLSNSLNKFLLSSNNVNNSNSEDSNNLNEKNSVDILEMLAKAQHQFNQNTALTSVNKDNLSISEPTSHSTPGGANNIFVDKMSNTPNEPKTIISQWPLNDLILNSNQYIKPEPIRAATASATTVNESDDRSMSADKINPILKLLMSSNSLANMPNSTGAVVSNNESAGHDQLSLDLKRKLNIVSSKPSDNNILSSPITVTGSVSNSSMILTPSNSSVIMSSTTNQTNQTNATLESVINILKKPITVKDFEENLLNQSSSQQSTPSTNSSHPKQLSNMFYLPNETNISLSSSNDLLYNKLISNSCSNTNKTVAVLPTTSKLDAKNTNPKNDPLLSVGSLTTTSISSVTCSSNNSTTSSSSTTSSDSSSDSESEPQSPNTLPLLLTPAAFESSASSTTSSSFNPTTIINNQFLNNLVNNNNNINKQDTSSNNTTANSKLSTTVSTTTNNNNITNSSSSMDLNEQATNFANSFENILISNMNEKANGLSLNEKNNIHQMSLLNKNQLQQVLIHLLNNDDQFLASLHQAYVKSTCQFHNKINKTSNNSSNNNNKPSTTNNNNNNNNNQKQYQNANKTPSQNQMRHNNSNNNSKQNSNNPVSYAKVVKK